MNIILITGIQGCGKSTHAKQLQHSYGFVHVCAGDLLRKHIDEGTEFGKSYQAAYNRGELAPNEVTCGIIGEALYGYLDDTIILDGFPRNNEQLEWLEKNYNVSKCIEIVLPLDVSTRRLLTRGRSDDSEEGIKTRFDLYKKHTQPVIDYYREKGKLVEVNGDDTIDEVFDEIIKQLLLQS